MIIAGDDTTRAAACAHAESKITAVNAGTLGGTISIGWQWRVDGDVGSLKGDFEVVSCLEP